jgi:hypothetical protein
MILTADSRPQTLITADYTDFADGETGLTIAQRFNAGFDNERKIKSRERTKETPSRPDGAQQREKHSADR